MRFQSSRKPMLAIFNLKKLLVMLICSALFFYVYVTYAAEHVDKELATLIDNDTLTVCKESLSDRRQFVYVSPDTRSSTRSTSTTSSSQDVSSSPTIYFVTPTYPRREQIAELTRLGQTLMHVRQLFWIVADDRDSCNPMLGHILDNFGIPYVHLSSPMPYAYRAEASHKTVPRGVSNRRAALNWIKNNKIRDGVLYFGDDDNTFDLRLFNEIRSTQRVSMFPVGLIGEYSVSTPIVKNGKVVAFFDSWPAKRKWPVDMAGFAVNLSYLEKFPNATMPFRAGYEEDSFLKSIGLRLHDIEPKANDCTEIYVWHTQTTKKKTPLLEISEEALDRTNSNLLSLLNSLVSMGVSRYSESGNVKATVSRDGKAKSLSNGLSIWA